MVDDPQEIILEHLRAIRTEQTSMREDIRELKLSMVGLREEVNGMRGDMLRQERGLASLEVDIDRIKQRLDLVE